MNVYTKKIEKAMDQAISSMGEKTELRDAIEYALKSGGKRFRPKLVLMIAKALNEKFDVTESALAVEFFHTASLIADDLPCMDNEKERRNKPTLHRVYGESISILASYTLISAGYEMIHKNAEKMKKTVAASQANEACSLALQVTTKCAGIFGATNGQFLDLFPPKPSLEVLKKTIFQKTVTLFEIAFVLAWLFAGGDSKRLNEIKNCAYHLGMAFQIADDLQDYKKDDDKSNIASFLGQNSALSLFFEHLNHFKQTMNFLKIFSPEIQDLTNLLETSAQKEAFV